MKYLSTIFFSFLILNITQAETFMGTTELSEKTIDNIIIFGPADLKDIKTNSLTVTGPLSFNNVAVDGNVTVIGPIKEDSSDLSCKDFDVLGPITAKNIKCDSINIIGSANLENIETTGDVKIVGSVEIEKAKLQNVTLMTSEMSLSDTTVSDITVEKIPLSGEPQTLYLKKGTIVSGSITFKSGKGVVILQNSSKVNGKINGATLEQSNHNKNFR